MTEQQWLSCGDPQEMLRYLTDGHDERGHGRHPLATDRKLRLFAAACVRRLFQIHTRPIYRSIIDTAEQVADGERRPDELEILQDAFGDNIDLPPPRHVQAVRWLCSPSVHNATRAAACVRDALDDNTEGCAVRQNQIHANLLRDILGNPFYPLVREDAYLANPLTHQIAIATHRKGEKDCLSRIVRHHWLTRDVIDMVQGIYDERTMPSGEYDPVRLAILADALEDAGCATVTCDVCGGEGIVRPRDAMAAMVIRACPRCTQTGNHEGDGYMAHPLLTHLRSTGPHVRGCWAIDLILGKE